MNRETFTLLLALISVIVAVATPEIRCYLGLQRDSCSGVKIPSLVVNPPAPSSTPVLTPVVSAPPPTPVSIPVLVSPPPPKPVPLPVSPPESGNVSDIFNPKPDKFEKTSEFQARREQLLTKFNQASQQGDARYQAGVASLKDYNADAENLFVTLEWQATWVKPFAPPKLGVMKIAPPAAQTFWQEGPQKLLYVQMERIGEQLKIKSGVLTGNGQVWYISFPPETSKLDSASEVMLPATVFWITVLKTPLIYLAIVFMIVFIGFAFVVDVLLLLFGYSFPTLTFMWDRGWNRLIIYWYWQHADPYGIMAGIFFTSFLISVVIYPLYAVLSRRLD